MKRGLPLNVLVKTVLILLICGLVVGCQVEPPPSPTPTRALSGPTVVPSATIHFITSDDLPTPSGGFSDPTAAALPNNAPVPPDVQGTAIPGGGQRVQVVADDGQIMNGELYQRGQARVPGILLVGMNLSAWGAFPSQLQAAGFTVLVVEIRPATVVDDMRVLLATMGELGTVDPSRIAVVGESAGADAALIGCATDTSCDAVVLISPLGRDTLMNVLPTYNPRPLFLTTSQDDIDSFRAVEGLSSLATGEVVVETFPGPGRGAQLLQTQQTLGAQIVGWLAGVLN